MLTVDARREALDAVEACFPKLPYMQRRWADKVTELIERHDLTRCLELGCFQGKSTAFETLNREIDRSEISFISQRFRCIDLSLR
jgi:hypothetical protein